MAQTSSIYNAPLSGNLGNQTYKNYGGKQVVTTRFHTTSAKGEGASRAQRDTRMLMPNLTLIGSSIKDWLPVLWENNKFFKRPYTHFISTNMQRDLLVLPKQMIDLRRSVWGELQVSSGTLSALHFNVNSNDDFYTDIVVNSSTSFDSVNWGSLSQTIINRNPDWSDGDSLVFVRVAYSPGGTFDGFHPYYSTPLITALTLDVNSSDIVRDSFHGAPLSISGIANTPYGTTLGIHNAGGYAWAVVHVRKYRGQYLCSSQVLTLSGMDSSFFDEMKSKSYITFCASSWGYKDKIL